MIDREQSVFEAADQFLLDQTAESPQMRAAWEFLTQADDLLGSRGINHPTDKRRKSIPLVSLKTPRGEIGISLTRLVEDGASLVGLVGLDLERQGEGESLTVFIEREGLSLATLPSESELRRGSRILSFLSNALREKEQVKRQETTSL